MQTFVILDVVPPQTSPAEVERRLYETRELIATYSGHAESSISIVQQRMHPDPTYYIGSGKVREMQAMMRETGVKHIVLNDIVQPTIIHELKRELWHANSEVEVWDRVDLILKIFQKHARTAEAKLQIELAAMRHMGPRIYGMGMILSRQGGGIGGRGIGETNTELMKRHWRDAIKQTQERLAKLARDRHFRLTRRTEIGMHTVSLVGYTNAGKSTLFNTLTGKSKLARDALFATLDSSVGKISYPVPMTSEDTYQRYESILVSDTIGFIRDLPSKLIEAFKSTLMEAIYADVLIHVVDASDPEIVEKVRAVQGVLTELGVTTKPLITVFNKIDLPPRAGLTVVRELAHELDPIYLSARDTDGIDKLKEAIRLKLP